MPRWSFSTGASSGSSSHCQRDVRALYIGITRTKVLTINAVVMALTNVVLDYALIFGHFGLPEMGIKGAAIASVIAEAASLLFFLIYTYITVDLKKYGLNRLRSFDRFC